MSKNEPSSFLALDFKKTSSKALGFVWIPHTDKFQFKVEFDPIITGITKRSVLSEIAKLFDPMDLISPIVIMGKLIMQEVCKLKFSWDESLPMSVHTE